MRRHGLWFLYPGSGFGLLLLGFFLLLFMEKSGPKSRFSGKMGYEGQSELEDMLEP